MIDTNSLLNKINSLPKDNTLYLLERLSSTAGLFALNGNVLYVLLNEEHCQSLNIETELLHLVTNVYVTAFNSSESSFENGMYNYVELQLVTKEENLQNLVAFVNLCIAHAVNMQGKDFVNFFNSLVSLFQMPREQEYKNLVGLLGELFLIEHIFQNNAIDISPYWHSDGVVSKLDFVCPSANLEVKTTTSDSPLFTIKHEQLFSCSKNYLVTICVEENNTGITLDELINSLLDNPEYCNNLKFSLNIEKEKRRVSPVDLVSKRFICKKIRAYHSENINPFTNIPDCVENLSYKLNTIQFAESQLSDIFKA